MRPTKGVTTSTLGHADTLNDDEHGKNPGGLDVERYSHRCLFEWLGSRAEAKVRQLAEQLDRAPTDDEINRLLYP